ncbi:unnamed protein product [Ceutorhynchus assimilis]|uniref:Poly [ADP-ribose] polymerase n=1 Tax=Ceutorhynchus assimilis TaxID=467358 RepID=A0A9P0DHE9_9CUCU|nr:unnamed protein product [Ceutorhynchus assimilis]
MDSTTSNKETPEQLWLYHSSSSSTPTFDHCKTNTTMNKVEELEKQENKFGELTNSLEKELQVLVDDSQMRVNFIDQINVNKGGVDIEDESMKMPERNGEPKNPAEDEVGDNNTKWFIKGNNTIINETKEVEEPQKQQEDKIENDANSLEEDFQVFDNKVAVANQINEKIGRTFPEILDEPTHEEPDSEVNENSETNTEWYLQRIDNIMNEAKELEAPQKQENVTETFEILLNEALSFAKDTNLFEEDLQVFDGNMDQIDMKRARGCGTDIQHEPARKAKENEEPNEVNKVGGKHLEWFIEGNNNIINEAEEEQEDKIENDANPLQENFQVFDDKIAFADQIDGKSGGASAEILEEQTQTARRNEEPDKSPEVNKNTEWNRINTIMNEANKLEARQKKEDKIETFENLLNKALSFEKVTNLFKEDVQVSDEDSDEVIFVDQIDVKSDQGAGSEICDAPTERVATNEEPDENPEVNRVCEKNTQWFMEGNNNIINEVKKPQKQQEVKIEKDKNSLKEDSKVLDEDLDEVIFVDQFYLSDGVHFGAGAKIQDEPTERADKNTEWFIPQVLDRVMFVDQSCDWSHWVASAEIRDEPTDRAERNQETDKSSEVNKNGDKSTTWNIDGTNTFMNEATELEEPQKQKDKIGNVENPLGETLPLENIANSLQVDLQVLDEDSDEVIFVDLKRGREADIDIQHEPAKRAKRNKKPDEKSTARFIKETNDIINETKELNKEKQQDVKIVFEISANSLEKDLQLLHEDSDEVIFVDQIDVKNDLGACAEIRDEPKETTEKKEGFESLEANGVADKNIKRYIKRTNTTKNLKEKALKQPPKQQKVETETFAGLLDKSLQGLDEDLDEVMFVDPAENEAGQKNTKWKPVMTYPKNRQLPIPKKIEKDFSLLADLQMAFNLPLYQNYHLWNYPNKLFTEILLPYDCPEYQMISNLFTVRVYGYEITQIFKIENPFISLHYHIAKSKFLTQNDEDELEEKFYFHGTWQENLPNICRFNFDRSKIIHHKFGKGISFAYNSKYATEYPKGCQRFNKMMVVAKTFYKHPIEIGYKNTIVPEGPSDTTRNQAHTVLVKYDDASYYPAYVINYHRIY